MRIETEVKISYKTVLGDHFDSKIGKKVVGDLIEKHVQDYCKEHGLSREDIKILRQKVISIK